MLYRTTLLLVVVATEMIEYERETQHKYTYKLMVVYI